MDGAHSLRIFRSVVLPIAKPAMAVLFMLTFVQAWNDFFWPIVVLSAQNPTVQVALSNLGQGYVPDRSIIMSGALIGTLPLLAVFPSALPGCQLHVAPDIVDVLLNPTSAGSVTWSLPLPNTPSISGITLYHQMVAAQYDPQLTFVSVASTNALQLNVGWF